MKGAERIREMRRRRIKPKVVWVTDFAFGLVECHAATVKVHGDIPEALDLRFLKAVPIVIVEGPDAGRIKRIADAVQEAGALRVITNEFDEDLCKVKKTTDTEGVMSWQR